MSKQFSAFSVGLKLFQAQSLLGVASMVLPFDKKYDALRAELYEAAMKVSHCYDVLDDLENA